MNVLNQPSRTRTAKCLFNAVRPAPIQLCAKIAHEIKLAVEMGMLDLQGSQVKPGQRAQKGAKSQRRHAWQFLATKEQLTHFRRRCAFKLAARPGGFLPNGFHFLASATCPGECHSGRLVGMQAPFGCSWTRDGRHVFASVHLVLASPPHVLASALCTNSEFSKAKAHANTGSGGCIGMRPLCLGMRPLCIGMRPLGIGMRSVWVDWVFRRLLAIGSRFQSLRKS